MKERWQERNIKCSVLHLEQVAEEKKKKEKIKAHSSMINAAILIEESHRSNEADKLADKYMNQKNEIECDSNTAPLILDAIVTPVAEPKPAWSCSIPSTVQEMCKKEIQAARNERDQALLQARQYRDMAEATRADKRALKHNLDGKIELVRDFWPNKIVEGGSRSGRMLRASLIRK